jgi:transposase
MVAANMKTKNISLFLKHVSTAYKNNFIIMVVDGGSTHKSKSLVIPNNVALILLPPYSPELTPVERVWSLLRRDYFVNRYFETPREAIDEAEEGLTRMKANRSKMKNLTLWPWIAEILNAT